MRADLPPVDTNPRANDVAEVPFACEYVTLTKQEHIELKYEAQRWKTLHRKALSRAQWREQRYARILRELKERGARAESKLHRELEAQQGGRFVFGAKSPGLDCSTGVGSL